MPFIPARKKFTVLRYEIGTQYVAPGATLTLGNPTYVDMSTSLFSKPGVYVLAQMEDGVSQLTGGASAAANVKVTGVPADRTILRFSDGQDAFWDASTSSICVRLG